MLILALDTTSRGGSLAIVRDGEVIHEMSGDPSVTHGQRLPLEFVRVCDGAGVRLPDIDLFAVAAGPGSFTGLRVGIAAIQGLAMALNRRVVPVSTSEAVATAAVPRVEHIAAWVDAQRGEVFAQLWHQVGSTHEAIHAGVAEVVPIGELISARPEVVVETWRHDGPLELDTVAFHGDGAVRYADRIREIVGAQVTIASAAVPLAATIGRIASSQPERAVLPHAIVPIYVRRPDAELARSRREGSG